VISILLLAHGKRASGSEGTEGTEGTAGGRASERAGESARNKRVLTTSEKAKSERGSTKKEIQEN
jgi:hypothetical protein